MSSLPEPTSSSLPQPAAPPAANYVDPFMGHSQSLSLGSCLCGIPTRLHFSFIFLLFLEVVISILFSFDPLYVLFVFLLYGPILLITIVVVSISLE